MNVLFVCHGNLNRSSAAEMVCRAERDDLVALSAGVGVKSEGRVMAAKMRRVLEARGYPHDGRTGKVTQSLLVWADAIYYFAPSNLRRLTKAWGDVYDHKLRSFAELVDLPKIADPHFSVGTHEHERVLSQIVVGVREISCRARES